MSSKSIELPVLGQVLRLNCPEEQHEALKQAARELDLRVSEMKERTGILQLERVLSIVALNLSYELLQAQQKRPPQLRRYYSTAFNNLIILLKAF